MKLLLTSVICVYSVFLYGQDDKLSELNGRISSDPENAALYYARAEAYNLLDQFDLANRDYKKVIEIYQGHPDKASKDDFLKSCYNLADDYFFRTGKRKAALTYIELGMNAQSSNRPIEVLDAIITGADSASYDLALEKYLRLSALYPEDIRLNLYFAGLQEKRAPEEAARLYEKVIAADPGHREALLSAATIYNNEAARLAGTQSDPKKIWEYAQKAVLYFERLHKLAPSDKELTTVLLLLYEELDQPKKAKELQEINTPY